MADPILPGSKPPKLLDRFVRRLSHQLNSHQYDAANNQNGADETSNCKVHDRSAASFIVDDIMARSFAIRQSKTILARS